MALIGAWPTLSGIEAFTTAHLVAAADRWSTTADLWEGSFTRLARDVLRPGGAEWTGDGAEVAQRGVDNAGVTARGASNQLRDAVGIATFGADQLDGLHAKTLDAIAAARDDGFQIDEDLSVTDTRRHPWGSSAYVARQAEAEEHAESIQSNARQLLALDNQYAAKLVATTEGLDTLTLDAPGGETPPANEHNGIQLVDYHAPLPESPKAPPPEPPPGGWSNDPITRAAQKVAYGHAWRDHSGEFPDMTKDQLAQQIEKMFRATAENPASLTIGRTLDGAPVLYDPKTNIVVIRDPGAADAGTAFKPTRGADYVENGKIATRVPSIPPGELADGVLRLAPPPVEAKPPEPPPRAVPPPIVESPAEPKAPAVRGGPMGGLPVFGGAVPDGSLPYLVDPPGLDAGGDDLPVIGDGEPDGPGL
jgi:hypothetical protein